MSEVYIRNRQRSQPVNLRLFHSVASDLVENLAPTHFELGVILVGARQMAQLNERFLQHAGPTDVITFTYSDESKRLHGDIFICVEEAVRQAEQYRISWQQELVRYLIHGVLHLQGYDDTTAPARTRMKKMENLLLRKYERRFSFTDLSPDGSRSRPTTD